MKKKYMVLNDSEIAEHNSEGMKIIKTFKHEQDAFDFQNDPKNIRMYCGSTSLVRRDTDGSLYIWNEDEEVWSEFVG